MLRKSLLLVILAILIAGSAGAQETYFGKNKVQYETFDWRYIQTRHFDIYFYGRSYDNAKFAAKVLENAYNVITCQINYQIHTRIPVFLYSARNDFQQTNIVPSLISEGVGGFTEASKNRVAIYNEGSVEDLRHVLHHELTHAIIYDMIYGNLFTSLLSRRRLFNLPLWFAEGYAEYSSRKEWHYRADMIVRDATVNNYLAPPDYIGGGMEYYEGFAMVRFIAETYGQEKIGELLAKGKVYLSMDKAIEAAIGVKPEEFWDKFSLEMKRRYWPEISLRKQPDEIGKALTDHTKDESNYNAKPVFSPQGDKLAIFSDRSDYPEIYLISAIDGKEIDKLVKAQRSGEIETVYSYYSSIGFSPDGEKIVFITKSQGRDALFFLRLKGKDIYLKKYFDYNSILSPVWSPDGTKIAFAALDGPWRDLVIYDIEGDSTYSLMRDRYDDMEPSWAPDSKRIFFSSDRPHPVTEKILARLDQVGADSIKYSTIYTDDKYGNYNIFSIDVSTRKITPIMCGPGQNREPVVSPDGEKICFVSNRNGIDNLYISYLDSSATFAITDILTGTQSPSWSPDGTKIAFSSFQKGGYDVYVIKDIQPAGNNGVLEPTGFVKGEYGQPIPSPCTKGTEEIASADTTADSIEVHPIARAEGLFTPADSTAADTTADSTQHAAVDSTRIEGGDFVYVEPTDETTNPIDTLFTPVSDSTGSRSYRTKEEQAVFDSIGTNNKLPDGEYKVKPYRAKFTPDYVSGGFSYDSFFGLRGQSAFIFSDYLGDNQIYLLTDLVNTLDQTNIMAYYFYNRRRTSLGAGIFHNQNYYLDNQDFLFSDRLYGMQLFASHPFSKYFRAETELSQYFIDRHYHDAGDPRQDRSTKVSQAKFSLVQDNIIWGVTGPLDGRRSRLDFTAAKDLFNESDISFYSGEFDYRRYWHIKSLFSLAARFSAGASGGRTPKRYFLGGTTNWIGNVVVDASVYDVENLYFSDVVTPLRGFDYYELSGTRYFLSNLEFRYPFIDYLKTNFPLPMTIGYVTGNIFFDMGSTWDGSDFKGGTTVDGPARLQDIKSAFGFGIRGNLGIFVLRYDLAWKTDFSEVAAHPKSYFSLGADF